jgi:hypothetical protein
MTKELTRPEDLYPKKIHRAEILLSPLFWFGLFLVVIYWKLMPSDQEQLTSGVQSDYSTDIDLDINNELYLVVTFFFFSDWLDHLDIDWTG